MSLSGYSIIKMWPDAHAVNNTCFTQVASRQV